MQQIRMRILALQATAAMHGKFAQEIYWQALSARKNGGRIAIESKILYSAAHLWMLPMS